VDSMQSISQYYTCFIIQISHLDGMSLTIKGIVKLQNKILSSFTLIHSKPLWPSLEHKRRWSGKYPNW